MDAITSDSTFDNEVKSKITEITGNFITPEDLTNNLSNYANTNDLSNLINTSLGNYIKKTDITVSNELNTLIDRKINAYNIQAQQYVNAQVQQTIPNMNTQIQNIANSVSGTTKLIGIINYAGTNNIINGIDNKIPPHSQGTLILGKDSNNSNIILSVSSFDEYKKFVVNKNDYVADSLICYFDWINDQNIFYINKLPYNYNYLYIANYPNSTISPFKTINKIKTNTKYLFDMSLGFGMKWFGANDRTYIGVYCILFNGTVQTPNYDIKLVTIFNQNGISSKYIKNNFVINTSDDTFNIGIYCVGFGIYHNAYGQIEIDPRYTPSSSISIYEISNLSQISDIQTITT
jgi:hypothetical protein